MSAARAVNDLLSDWKEDQLPTNVGQAYELAAVPSDDRSAVWGEVREATDGRPTAKSVAEAAAEYRQRNGEPTQTPMGNADRASLARDSFKACLRDVHRAVKYISGGIDASDAEELRSEIRAIRELLDQIEGEI